MPSDDTFPGLKYTRNALAAEALEGKLIALSRRTYTWRLLPGGKEKDDGKKGEEEKGIRERRGGTVVPKKVG